MSTPSSTQQQQLKPKNIYVETYSDNIDKSALLGELLVNIGAIYRKKLCKTLDYIIFKDGKLKTMKYAVDNDIPLVNPLWLHDQLNNKFQGDNNYLIKRTFTELHLEINNKKRTKDKEALFDMDFKQKQQRKRRITMKDDNNNNNMSILDVFSKESKDSECKCNCNSNNISRSKVKIGKGEEDGDYNDEGGSSKWKNRRSKRRSEGWWNCKWGGRCSKGGMIKEGNKKLNAVSYGLNENQIEFLNDIGIRRLITYKGEYDDYVKENSNKDEEDSDSSSDNSESELDINNSDTISYNKSESNSYSKSNNKSITTNKNDNIMNDIDVVFLQNNFDKYNWIILSFFISNKIIVNISYFISFTADLDDTTVVHSDNNNTTSKITKINTTTTTTNPTQTLTPKQLEPLSFKNPFPPSPPSLKSKTSITSLTPSPLKYTFILSTTIPPNEHALLKQIITLYLSQPLLDITNPFTLIPPHTYIISYIPLLTSQPTLSVKYIYDCYYSAKLIELNDTTKRKYAL